MEADCIFCKISEKKVPAKLLLEDNQVVAFEDASPKAPVHCLVISRQHVRSIMDDLNGGSLYPAIFGAIRKIAAEKGIADKGFRVVTNCGPAAGQSVDHLHFHVLGGRPLRWPPG